MKRAFRIPFVRSTIAREVDDELRFHLETRTQQLIATGLTPDAARHEALRQFGDVGSVRDDCVTMDNERERAVSRANHIEELQQDVMYALRTLRRNKGFTAVIVIALALGIGANTAIFTLINAVVVRTLPVPHPEELVAIGNTQRVSSFSDGSPRTDLISYPLYLDIRDNSKSLKGVLASGSAGRLDARVDSTGGTLEHPRGRYVSGNYFTVLGVPAARGRVFSDADTKTGTVSPVVTISYKYWTERFHNDPDAVGKTIVINNNRLTIIGVAAPYFKGDVVGSSADVWLPATLYDALHVNSHVLGDRGSDWLLLLGRLAPGVTQAQAYQELSALITRTIVANSTGAAGQSFLDSKPPTFIEPGARGFSRVRATFQTPLITLMVGVALLLCIICANVANLLLARAIARGKEMAVRLALGANRARLVRQLFTESLVLALLGAAAGLVLAAWGSEAVLVLASDGPTIPLDLTLDARVMLFTAGVSVGAVLLFGLVPALRASHVELASAMRANASSVAGSALGHRGQRAPLGKLLIAGQVALSVVLLVGAAMLVRNLQNARTMDMGFDRDHLLIVDLDVGTGGYTHGRLDNLAHALQETLAAIPGVTAAPYSENGIFSGSDNGTTIDIPGTTRRPGPDRQIAYDEVSPGYVAQIGAHLLAGREFDRSDETKPGRVMIVNQQFANFYFADENPVGKFVTFQDSVPVEIVGLVGDTHDHAVNAPVSRRAYFSYVHSDTLLSYPGTLRFLLRTGNSPAALVQQVRKAVMAIDPLLPIDGIDPLPVLMSQDIREERLVTKMASAFGILALILASIGLYGVMTYAISRRTNEIGLRVALGAQQDDVVRMVLFDALRLVAAGILVGLPLALGSMRLLKAQLHGVGAADPVAIGSAIAVLGISAVIAVLVPALRAANVSPMVALRGD